MFSFVLPNCQGADAKGLPETGERNYLYAALADAEIYDRRLNRRASSVLCYTWRLGFAFYMSLLLRNYS